MLDDNLKSQLKTYLTNVKKDIELVASVDDSAKSKEMLDLLTGIVALTDKITLKEVRDDAERKPSFRVNRPGEDINVRFAGLPMGHEFTSLVLALLHVGGHPPKEEARLLEQIVQLEGEYEFETYISLSCHNCPVVVQALNLMAALNPNVKHTMIDGALFQDEVDSRQVMAVPTVYLNGQEFGAGRMTLEEILTKADTKASERQAKELSEKAPYDLLVVGGGPAGASAAIYAARKGIRTGIVADRFGGQVMDTVSIENFISVQETEGPKLVAQLEQHVRQYEVDIMTNQKAVGMVPGSSTEVQLENGATLKSKAVLIATGASWREMNVPGEQEYRGKGVAYCPHCDGPLFKGKRVAVIGGGNSGVEAAIDLAGIVAHVTLIEFDDKLRADAVLQKKLNSLPNVTIVVSALTKEVLGDGNKVVGLNYEDRTNGEMHKVDLEGIFVQIGLLPNTAWAKGVIELSPRGEIVVDERGQTSVPGIFAAGDVTTVPYKQIIIAMGEGAKASLGAFDYLIRSSVQADS
ncbi:alkyl hydroperoxide reductase subunit F [Ketobacter alkanivorans]|uniref:Alkyl hydroperoxide reductase subunit F n=1 Tax=Ketobacter alkanivorans TaxID=1917421 RepID=A0A2K9LNI6_9GAMM|nr:alkyl hydroperoxide reductase subunit F [Ketobacter alkanivorans]AUM13701.1 alkyl hydroperoxide reductase subunit F [Ketobacter alkanivorans]MCP5018495.1 alkyl hydroperoxide reductase subunit F [Ketobacter sp.]